MALKIYIEPECEPLSLAEIKTFLRIGSNEDEDNFLGTLATIARKEAEKITRRQLITATWNYYLDKFPEIIYLPVPPIQSVTHVKYLDSAGDEQTLLADTDYLVDIYSEPGRIMPCFGMVWPSIYPEVNAVRIRFVSGYGDADSDVPEPIRQWMLMAIGAMYENRELMTIAPSSSSLVEFKFLDGLLDDYRVWPLGG